jgi:hypothetical protein
MDPVIESAALLGELESEFRTRQVVRIGADFYEVDKNGGSRGAWQNGKTTVTAIDRREARRILLEMNVELDEVARLTDTTTIDVEAAS